MLAVAGCDGGDPSPTTVPTQAPPSTTVAPSTPPPTTPAPTPTPTPPPLPAIATQDTPAGAQAFARHWLATLDYAYKTGDTKPFLALGGCPSCLAIATGIDKFYGEGGKFEGGDFTASDVQTTRHVKSSAALVDLVYSRTAGRAVPASGSVRVTPAEKNTEFILTLERQGQRWELSSVKTVSR